MEPDKKRPRCVIRRIKPDDFPAAATISANAMMDDELMRVICPKRKEYYNHFRDGFLRRLRTRYWKPGNVIFVAVTIPDDNENAPDRESDEKIVGLCSWERSGKGLEARSWIDENDRWWSKLQLLRCRVTDSVVYYFFPDKSADESKIALYLSSVNDGFSPDIFTEMWFLEMLAVDPEYQGQGIGRLLTQWGIDQANAERLPIGLESSVKGKILYEKLGFRTFKTVDGFEGIETAIMVWEPAVGEEESWYERAKKKTSRT